jgi:hypothetical protein
VGTMAAGGPTASTDEGLHCCRNATNHFQPACLIETLVCTTTPLMGPLLSRAQPKRAPAPQAFSLKASQSTWHDWRDPQSQHKQASELQPSNPSII